MQENASGHSTHERTSIKYSEINVQPSKKIVYIVLLRARGLMPIIDYGVVEPITSLGIRVTKEKLIRNGLWH